MEMATRVIWVTLIVLLVLVVGGILLQIFLFCHGSVFPGIVFYNPHVLLVKLQHIISHILTDLDSQCKLFIGHVGYSPSRKKRRNNPLVKDYSHADL